MWIALTSQIKNSKMLRLTKLFGIYQEIFEKIPPCKWDCEELQNQIKNKKIPLYIVGREEGFLLLAADQFEVNKISLFKIFFNFLFFSLFIFNSILQKDSVKTCIYSYNIADKILKQVYTHKGLMKCAGCTINTSQTIIGIYLSQFIKKSNKQQNRFLFF